MLLFDRLTVFYYYELLLQCFVSAVLPYQVFLTSFRKDGSSETTCEKHANSLIQT